VEVTAQFKDTDNSSKKLHSYITPEKSVYEDLPHNLEEVRHEDPTEIDQVVGIQEFQKSSPSNANRPEEVDKTPTKIKQRS